MDSDVESLISEDELSDGGFEFDPAGEVQAERVAIDSFMSACGVSEDDAKLILNEYNWDVNDACSAYMEDPTQVRLKAGILNLTDGPIAHDSEGIIWTALWMYGGTGNWLYFCWDDQIQIEGAFKRGLDNVTLVNKRAMGKSAEAMDNGTRTIDFKRMVQVDSRQMVVMFGVKQQPLSEMPEDVQTLVSELNCHPLAAINLLERCATVDRVRGFWQQQEKGLLGLVTPDHEIVDGKDFQPESLKRLTSELKELNASGTDIEVDPVNDQLSHWEVRVYKDAFDKDCWLYKDMTVLPTMLPGKQNHLKFEILFDAGYPQTPPFIFMKSPRLRFRSGHVAMNGAICLELLANTGTTTGYNNKYSVATLFRLVLTNMTEQSEHAMFSAARLDYDFGNGCGYNASQAREDFRRVARQHGWRLT